MLPNEAVRKVAGIAEVDHVLSGSAEQARGLPRRKEVTCLSLREDFGELGAHPRILAIATTKNAIFT
jgi:hypothetical protein